MNVIDSFLTFQKAETAALGKTTQWRCERNIDRVRGERV